MQGDQPTFAKSVVTASYVSRRGSGACVRQVQPANYRPSSHSSLKVKQYLNQVAKQERAELCNSSKRRLERSASLDCNASASRIFEYKIDSNKMAAEKTFDNSRGYPELVKPLALKPLVLNTSPGVSLSQVLGSELFASGSIPSNKEIDQIIEVIKTVRQRTSSASEDETQPLYSKARRHSDVSDLRSNKRSIKDPPSRPSSRRPSLTSQSQNPPAPNCKQFGSSNSAFKSIGAEESTRGASPPKPRRRCSQAPIIENVAEEEPSTTPTKDNKPSRIYPILSPLEEHMPKIVPHIPQKFQLTAEPAKAPTKASSTEPRAPAHHVPADNTLRTTPSPDNETALVKSGKARPTVDSKTYLKRNSFSSGFSVRNPTSRPSTSVSPKSRRSQSICSSSGSSSGADDFVLQHTLMRKARHRHRKCSQPCMVNNSDDEGIDNLPRPRYSPNTHPRAQHPSHLANCSGNHPPVSYLNSMKRSKSLQVNHIAMHDIRNFRKFNVHNSGESSDHGRSPVRPCRSGEASVVVEVQSQQPVGSLLFDESQAASTSEIDQVKNILKQVGRKYLTDECTAQHKDPQIDKKNSLSFIFNGNKDLQDKVRTFFQQTNKTYCKRIIKQRFESNPLDFTPDSSVVDPGELEDAVRPLSEYSEVINAEIQNRHSRNLDESIHSFLIKSEGFVSNKCGNLGDHDKLTKLDKFLDLENLKTPSPPVPPLKACRHDPLQNHTTVQLTSRIKYGSANSDISDYLLRRNGSKASRDSGYGDSTSASNEGLNPPKSRARSSSLTILSKLKPLFGLKKRDPPVPQEDNPFSRIFEDHPISELAKSLDTLIARRSSLPNPDHIVSSPERIPYNEDVPVFDSPSNNITQDITKPTEDVNPEEVLNEFNSLFGSMTSQLLATSQMPSAIQSEDDEESEFRVSPLPDDSPESECPGPCDEETEEMCIVRRSFDDLCSEPYTRTPIGQSDNFSLQDIQEILDSFDVLQQSAPASDREYHKVHKMLQTKLTIALSSIYHTLIEAQIPPSTPQYLAKSSLDETLQYLDELLDLEEDNENIMELVGLLESFEDIVDLHDEVICRTYYENETLPEMKTPPLVAENSTGTPSQHSIYRMVGLHKHRGEPLGITLKKEEEKVVVHRILAGGMIDRQRLLHIGDVIISINGQDVQPKPDVIQLMLKDQEGDIHLKIIPSYREQTPVCQVYVKAHFSYDPSTDSMMPCKEAGLKFEEGDILQIVNQDDQNWWQAKLEGGEGQAGLIPGLILQEQRMATNGTHSEKSSSIGCGGASRKKKKNKKMNYSATKNSDFDQHELNLYEEVAKMPPFNRKTLVLIGAQGVGRRSLISKLVLNEPDKFGNTMPHTSRPIRSGERDGGGYWFTNREKMDEDIQGHKYLEYGEYEGHLYGTKLDSIRQVMRSGKMCLLDVNPQSLKVLKTSEFVPYIVFVEAPPFETLVKMHKESSRDNPNKSFTDSDLKKSIEESKRLKRQYSHYFDVIIQNNDMDATYAKLYECISKLSTSPQWVPVSWVY